MSSQVLALKYRPQNFEEVVGQETTVRILQNAILQKRIHHAWLFTGPRGIGKTSLARIFAKALNCEKGPVPTPCNQCIPCREITEGRSLSVIEIDGASNTSVEDVRNLREQIRYLPPGGGYKIYIIDEVHMLSTAAFNALLKTLEEPPPHALFIFATTEPQKVPATIVSRVIRFDLRPIPPSVIVSRLQKIIGREGVQAEPETLFQIAREAGGALRDALSLLDQVISFSGKNITRRAVEEVIGVGTFPFLYKLMEAILNQNGKEVIRIAGEATGAGVETKRLSLDLLEYLRHLLVARVSQEPGLFDLPPEEIRSLASLGQSASEEDLDRLFRILQQGVTEILRSPLPQILLDVFLLRLCHYRHLRSLDEILRILNGASPVAIQSPQPQPQPQKKGWPEFLSFLRSSKPQIHSLVQEGRLVQLGETEVVLHFLPQSISLTLLQDPERESLFREQLKQYFGRPLLVRYGRPGGNPQPTGEGTVNNVVEEALAIFGPGTTLS